ASLSDHDRARPDDQDRRDIGPFRHSAPAWLSMIGSENRRPFFGIMLVGTKKGRAERASPAAGPSPARAVSRPESAGREGSEFRYEQPAFAEASAGNLRGMETGLPIEAA